MEKTRFSTKPGLRSEIKAVDSLRAVLQGALMALDAARGP